MPLALSRDPGPTPSVGHVTGDMKRRESNETLTVDAYRSVSEVVGVSKHDLTVCVL